MKKIILITLTFCTVIALTFAAGCVGGGDPIVGTWQCGEKTSLAFIYTFNADGTGTYTTFMTGKEIINQKTSWKKISDGTYSVSSSDAQRTMTLRSGVLFDGGREYLKV